MGQVYTDRDRVVAMEDALSAYDVTALDELIASVSGRMSSWMDRVITTETVTEEFDVTSGGAIHAIVLSHWPVANPSAIDGDLTQILADDLTVKRDRELYKQDAQTDRYPTAWLTGTVTVTYSAGYGAGPGSIPLDLTNAATRQVVAEALQSQENRVGIAERVQQTGSTETFNEDGWLPSVVQAMQPYRRSY